ncbi:MAG: DJ-1/PfpI family protein [Propionibacteriaceae bacterium]|jgi:4-methyl-5(b-hydroxyethyl)-thiazole monophosphate biosynthesis|nr:DJ-1/PfpI family protein [Propionibacteriaceae bacterium]
MTEGKGIAVIVYAHFSLQEVSCLTDALAVWFNRIVEVYATSKAPVRSEDGFLILPDKTLEEFEISQYECVLLPGILNPLPALFDLELIDFLRTLKGSDILIGAISSAPMLLAKAGLLDDRRYTAGVWEDINRYLDFIPHHNIDRKPLVRDGNLITAIGSAFREFAVETIRALGIDDCEGGLFNPVPQDFTPEEYWMTPEDFEEFKAEYAIFSGEMQYDQTLPGRKPGIP